MGLASSFYNDRNEDIAEALVKTLLETRQAVPDFLEAYLPEGFTMDGQTGDVATLNFDDDSDDEEEGGENAEGGAEGGAWGTEDAATGGGWGAAETTEAAAADDAWGAPTSGDNGWN